LGIRVVRATLWPVWVFTAAANAGCAGSGVPPSPPIPTPTVRAVRGTVTVMPEGEGPGPAPVVVMLERIDGHGVARSEEHVWVVSSADLFEPPFTVVGVDDIVILSNVGRLKHRLFSADIGGDVVLPLEPEGGTVPLSFVEAGLKRFFCSLHPDGGFSMLVSGTPYFDVVDQEGNYAIEGVPEGLYRLSVWSEAVAGPVRQVRVDGSRRLVEDIRVFRNRVAR